jgi:hypothetical protein
MTSAKGLSWRSGEPRRLSAGDRWTRTAGPQLAATPQAIAEACDVLQSAIADLRT